MLLTTVYVAYIAYRSIRKHAATSSALRRISDVPSVVPSDLQSDAAAEKLDNPVAADSGVGVIVERTRTNMHRGWGLLGWTAELGDKMLTTVFGLAAYIAYRKHAATSSALRRISDAPSVVPSDLRSEAAAGKLVVVRGSVDNNPVAADSGVGVIVERTRSNMYRGWGLLGWTAELGRKFGLLGLTSEPGDKLSLPNFILVEGEKWPYSHNLVVNMEGSDRRYSDPDYSVANLKSSFQLFPKLPRTTGVNLHVEPNGVLVKEIILPRGKDVTAVGIVYAKEDDGDGSSDRTTLEIKSCNDLPYFLTNLTRDQIVGDLSSKTTLLVWTGITSASVAIFILASIIARKWKAYRPRKFALVSYIARKWKAYLPNKFKKLKEDGDD